MRDLLRNRGRACGEPEPAYREHKEGDDDLDERETGARLHGRTVSDRRHCIVIEAGLAKSERCVAALSKERKEGQVALRVVRLVLFVWRFASEVVAVVRTQNA